MKKYRLIGWCEILKVILYSKYIHNIKADCQNGSLFFYVSFKNYHYYT